MIDLSNMSLEELLFDRQECFNDLVALAIAKLSGVTHYSTGTVRHRIDSNLAQIEVIRRECERRGIDPAMYRSKENNHD